MAKKIERGALGGQDGAQRSADARDRCARFDAVAVGGVKEYRDAFVDQGERARERLETGDDSRRPADRVGVAE